MSPLGIPALSERLAAQRQRQRTDTALIVGSLAVIVATIAVIAVAAYLAGRP